MAQKVQVILIDDIDGGHADETVSFALDGVSYEIDLAAARAAELRASLEPWMAHARHVGVRSTRRARSGQSPEIAAMRAWAKANGLPVNERGRISANVRRAYSARSI